MKTNQIKVAFNYLDKIKKDPNNYDLLRVYVENKNYGMALQTLGKIDLDSLPEVEKRLLDVIKNYVSTEYRNTITELKQILLQN